MTPGALTERAEPPATPTLHYVPSPMINAFTVGSAGSSAIALTDGLLRHPSYRELTGVLAHEVAHIAHGDLQVLGLADYISRLAPASRWSAIFPCSSASPGG